MIEKVVLTSKPADVSGEVNTETIALHTHCRVVRAADARGASTLKTRISEGVIPDRDPGDEDGEPPLRMKLRNGDPIDKDRAM